jgi:hypothetical protein
MSRIARVHRPSARPTNVDCSAAGGASASSLGVALGALDASTRTFSRQLGPVSGQVLVNLNPQTMARSWRIREPGIEEPAMRDPGTFLA